MPKQPAGGGSSRDTPASRFEPALFPWQCTEAWVLSGQSLGGFTGTGNLGMSSLRAMGWGWGVNA